MAVVWCVHVVDGTGGGLIETPGDDHFQRAHPAAANFCLLYTMHQLLLDLCDTEPYLFHMLIDTKTI